MAPTSKAMAAARRAAMPRPRAPGCSSSAWSPCCSDAGGERVAMATLTAAEVSASLVAVPARTAIHGADCRPRGALRRDPDRAGAAARGDAARARRAAPARTTSVTSSPPCLAAPSSSRSSRWSALVGLEAARLATSLDVLRLEAGVVAAWLLAALADRSTGAQACPRHRAVRVGVDRRNATRVRRARGHGSTTSSRSGRGSPSAPRAPARTRHLRCDRRWHPARRARRPCPRSGQRRRYGAVARRSTVPPT